MTIPLTPGRTEEPAPALMEVENNAISDIIPKTRGPRDVWNTARTGKE